MLKLLSEVVVEQPETLGFLSEILNNAFTWVMGLGTAGFVGVSTLLRAFVPSNGAIVAITDKINELKEMTNLDAIKIKELETAQKQYQQANDDLLMEIAKNSPNVKVKELGKQLEQKKQELTIQEQIQEKVNQAVKSVEAKAVTILKKKD
jgi:hypothetical protein